MTLRHYTYKATSETHTQGIQIQYPLPPLAGAKGSSSVSSSSCFDIKNHFHISKFVSWRMRVICRKCYWELSLERTKRTCLSLVYVTTRKQPSATNPFPPTERQNHCVTCPSGTRRDACTRETVRPDTNANWGEKNEQKNTREIVT